MRSARGSVWSISISLLVPSLTVAENIILGVAPKKGLFIDMDKAVKAAEDIAKEYNFDIDVRQKVEEIPVGIKQKVEILKVFTEVRRF